MAELTGDKDRNNDRAAPSHPERGFFERAGGGLDFIKMLFWADWDGLIVFYSDRARALRHASIFLVLVTALYTIFWVVPGFKNSSVPWDPFLMAGDPAIENPLVPLNRKPSYPNWDVANADGHQQRQNEDRIKTDKHGYVLAKDKRVRCSRAPSPWMCGPVRLFEFSLLEPQYSEADLRGYLAPEQVVMLRAVIEGEARRSRATIVNQRRTAIRAVALFVNAYAMGSSPPDIIRRVALEPSLAERLSVDEIAQLNFGNILQWFQDYSKKVPEPDPKEFEADIELESQFLPSGAKTNFENILKWFQDYAKKVPKTDLKEFDAVLQLFESQFHPSGAKTNFENILKWFQDHSKKVPEPDRKEFDAVFQLFESQFRPPEIKSNLLKFPRLTETEYTVIRRQRYLSALQSLEHAWLAEIVAFKSILLSAPNLHPRRGFDWLYGKSGGWLVDMLFWVWAGVLVSVITSVFVTVSTENYKPQQFVLAIPRLVIAPITAIILLALWAAGFTESGMSFDNLPFFLVAAFVMGFGNDRVVQILKRATKSILGGMELSTKRLEDEAKRNREYAARYQLIADPPSPDSLQSLRHTAKVLTAAELEKVMVNAAGTTK